MRKLSLGFSSCPNDTYIFDALIHRRIPHQYSIEITIADVEALNRHALSNNLDITKISIHAFFQVMEHYCLLSSGGALGEGCGPLVIGKQNSLPSSGRVALPGQMTTASLLFSMKNQGDYTYCYMPFDEVIPAVIKEKVDCGVIIHESRFTYQKYNLNMLDDLGAWWERETGCLLPLGGIAIKRSLPYEIQRDFDRLIQKSLMYAQKKPHDSKVFIQKYAQEIDPDVIQKHIHLYVNEYSKNLGKEGKLSIETMYRKSTAAGLFPGLEKRSLFC